MIKQEITENTNSAFETNTSHNLYLDDGDCDGFPPEHIRNRKFPTRVDLIMHHMKICSK